MKDEEVRQLNLYVFDFTLLIEGYKERVEELTHMLINEKEQLHDKLV